MSKDILLLQERLLSLNSKDLDLETASLFYPLALDWKAVNRPDKALLCFQKAFSFYKNDPPSYEMACDLAIQIGHLHRGMGQHKKTRSFYFEALKLSQVNQKDTVKTGAAYYHLGTLAEQTWNLKHAINFYEKSLAVYELFSDDEIVSELKNILLSCQKKQLIHQK